MTKEQHDLAIEALVEYFTGSQVGHHSICLGGPVHASFGATAFFKVREACQIRGYANAEEARKSLTTLFPWKGKK